MPPNHKENARAKGCHGHGPGDVGLRRGVRGHEAHPRPSGRRAEGQQEKEEAPRLTKTGEGGPTPGFAVRG